MKEEIIECACGCGTKLNKYDNRGRKRRFIRGHHGRCMSNETKKKISDASKRMSKESRKKQGKSLKGFKHTDETRKKMSIVQMGHKVSDETKKKISERNIGKKPSEETRKKISKSLKGRIFSEEHKNKLSEAGKGKIISKEQRKKLSELLKGNKHPNYGKTFSEEHKKNISKGKTGKMASEYTKKILSKAHMGLQAGEKHPNWKGGISFDPYCKKFNNNLKEKVRNRDNRTCQNCGVKENGRRHTVHHIHYDKENCYPDLITLCGPCNIKANINRKQWECFYMNKLNERQLLYWTQQIVLDTTKR